MTDFIIPRSMATQARAGPVRLIDMVFPGDTNHHGTLFGGVAQAHMDKVAFLCRLALRPCALCHGGIGED